VVDGSVNEITVNDVSFHAGVFGGLDSRWRVPIQLLSAVPNVGHNDCWLLSDFRPRVEDEKSARE
jgi:hypothetical protein